LTDELVTAFLRRVRAPTLVVAAARGLPALQQHLPRASALIADAQVVRLDGGHHLHMDDPGLVAAAVGDFLRDGRRFPSGHGTRAHQPDG
jgi:pimeloyl-ACP methyl ester carboxylesterase